MEKMETGTALYFSETQGGDWRPAAVARRVRRELKRRGLVCPGTLELEVFPSGTGLLVFVVSPVLRWAHCKELRELLEMVQTYPAAARRGCVCCDGCWYIALPGAGESCCPPEGGERVALSGALLCALAGLSP